MGGGSDPKPPPPMDTPLYTELLGLLDCLKRA